MRIKEEIVFFPLTEEWEQGLKLRGRENVLNPEYLGINNSSKGKWFPKNVFFFRNKDL